MAIRTDLATELVNKGGLENRDVYKEEKIYENVNLEFIKILTKNAEEKLGRPIGDYITLSFGNLLTLSNYENIENSLLEGLKKLLPQGSENALVVGLGNREITCDAVGPATAEKLLATRHIAGAFAEKIGLMGLKSVAITVPNVMGKTGIEAGETVRAIVDKINPSAVLVIDALAAGSLTRLFTTIQLSNTGISPGSGVKNSRKELSRKTLGVPVIAIGVPTVTDAVSLSEELCKTAPKEYCDMVVTPKDCDILIHKISEILASALNRFLQPEIEPEILSQLV